MRLVSARVILLAAVALVDAAPRVAALRLTLSHVDVERAISLARWPHTDAERAAFHSRYIADVSRAPVDSWTVDRIELITEFRRLELMAEEHARRRERAGHMEDAAGERRAAERTREAAERARSEAKEWLDVGENHTG